MFTPLLKYNLFVHFGTRVCDIIHKLPNYVMSFINISTLKRQNNSSQILELWVSRLYDVIHQKTLSKDYNKQFLFFQEQLQAKNLQLIILFQFSPRVTQFSPRVYNLAPFLLFSIHKNKKWLYLSNLKSYTSYYDVFGIYL
jgi:hypothetical protein